MSWRGPWEGVNYHFLRARKVDHGANELSQVGEMALLMGRPRRRHSKQSMGERLVVGKNGKVSTFKHKPEMVERRVGCPELRSKGEYFFLVSGSFLE